jgi:hypothetical protein
MKRSEINVIMRELDTFAKVLGVYNIFIIITS